MNTISKNSNEMEKIKTINEQIANKCIHFNGLMNKECDKGIKYDSIKDTGTRPYKVPCLKDSVLSGSSCSEVCFPSNEEVEKQVKEIQEEGQKTTEAYRTIKDHIIETGNMFGSIQCPSCGGKLHYQCSPDNGHLWANCKCGFGWME